MMTLFCVAIATCSAPPSLSPPLPEMATVRAELERRWRNVPPFRADFILHRLLAPGPEFERIGVPPWFPADGTGDFPGQSGWISIYPGHIRYQYIGKPPRFDITEVPLEVRYDGEKIIKFNEFSQFYTESYPSDESLRRAWSAHFMITLWQINFINRLRPGAEICEYLLPDALERPGYRVSAWERVDGIDCVRLERPDQDYLWLAPGFDWNIVRRRWKKMTPAGESDSSRSGAAIPLFFDSHHRDFVRVNGRYMPKEIRMAEQVHDGYILHRLLVRDYRSIPDEEFRPVPGSGWTWHVTRDGKLGQITQDSGGFERFEALIDRLKTKMPPRTRRTSQLLLWLAAMIPFGITSVIMLTRRLAHGHR